MNSLEWMERNLDLCMSGMMMANCKLNSLGGILGSFEARLSLWCCNVVLGICSLSDSELRFEKDMFGICLLNCKLNSRGDSLDRMIQKLGCWCYSIDLDIYNPCLLLLCDGLCMIRRCQWMCRFDRSLNMACKNLCVVVRWCYNKYLNICILFLMEGFLNYLTCMISSYSQNRSFHRNNHKFDMHH